MTMAKVFTPLIRDGVDPERKAILLEDFLAWLIDRAEDNSVSTPEEALRRQADMRTQEAMLSLIDQFLNDRTALGLSS